MKHIEVVAAIIVHDGKILATQRGYGNYKGSWEFPGGKIEPGEAPEAALGPKAHHGRLRLSRVRDDDAVLCLHARQQHEATRAQRCALAGSRRVR